MRRFIAIILLTTLAAACGANSSGGGGGELSVSVIEPASGTAVSVPFTVKVESSVPLGPTESGRHHVHIWFDDNESDYLVVESDTVQLTDAPAGQHTMHVSLRNANHSAAGAEATTPLNIGSGAPAPAPTATSSTEPDGPYDY